MLVVESKLCGQKLSCPDNSHATPYVQRQVHLCKDCGNHSGNNAQPKHKRNLISPEVMQARAFF